MTGKKYVAAPKSFNAMFLLGIFYFIFFSAQYSYTSAYAAGGIKAEIAHGCVFVMSALGFVLCPLLFRSLKKRGYTACLCLSTVAIVYLLFACRRASYATGLPLGMALFLLLGLLGSAAHDLFFRLTAEDASRACTAGFAWAFGVLLYDFSRFLKQETMGALILLAFSFALLALLLCAERICRRDTKNATEDIWLLHDKKKDSRKRRMAAERIFPALTVLLLAGIFETLSRSFAVALQGAEGVGPLTLLTAAGCLAGGFLLTNKRRDYADSILYCLLLLPILCVELLLSGGAALAGAILCELSFGVFAVFFTVTFLDLAPGGNRQLWAGMGFVLYCLGVALFADGADVLIGPGNGTASAIRVLTLFVAAGASMVIKTILCRLSADEGGALETTDSAEAPRSLPELLDLTPREVEVFDKLVNTEKNVQEIADDLYLSRRTCQRHIAAIYDKAGVTSRMGLYKLYLEKERR